MRTVYVACGILLAGVIVIAVLLRADFFGLFEVDLSRWEGGIEPSLLQPAGDPIGVDELADYADDVDEQLATLLKEGPAAYTPEQANAWADELIPIVERICQRTFSWRPVIRVVDRAALAEAIAAGLLARYEAISPELAGPFLEHAVRTDAAFASATYLGMYDPGGDILYLAPTNVRAIMQLDEIDERHIEPFVKLIIAHELTHALQRQVVDPTDAPAYVNTPDGADAYSSVIEGHAVFVSELVAAELGIDETSVEMATMLSAGVVSIDDPVFGAYRREAEVRHEEVYIGGRVFIAHHHTQGDMSRVWEIVAKPPPSTAAITDPTLYGVERRATTRYYHALKGIEKEIGPAWRLDTHWPLTALDLHEHFSHLDNELRDRVVAGIDHARTLWVNVWPGEEWGRISLFVLRGDADIEHYYAAVAAADKRMTGWTFADEAENLPGLAVDQSRRHTHVPDPEFESEKPWRHVHARRGVVIIEFYCTDMALSDGNVAGVVNTILDRLDASRDET